MVVFTCNNCGESLQKPKVEKHFSFSCRGSKNLTCVDCFKDFRGEEYVTHTKCVTENQRYGGKDYVEKAKKGEVKQESWMEMIKSILMHKVDITAGCRNLLNSICNFDNVPRKKQKFINFIKSSTGGRASVTDIEGVWDLIEKHKNEGVNKHPAEENSTADGKRKLNDEKKAKLDDSLNGNELTVEGEPLKKKKKNKRRENEEVIEANDKSENSIEQPKKKKKGKRKDNKVANEDDNKTEDDDESISTKEENTGSEKIKIEDENMEEVNEEEKPKKKKKSKSKENGTVNIENNKTDNSNGEILEKGNNCVDKDQSKKQKKKNLTDNAKDNYVANSDVEVIKEKDDKNGVSESTNHINNEEQFCLLKEIENILAEKGAVALKKLEKKLLKKYKSLYGEGANLDKFSKKFNKKIKRFEGISVDDNVVKLKVE